MTQQTNMQSLEVVRTANGIQHRNPPELGMRPRCVTCGGELYIRKYGVIVQIGCNRCGKHVGIGRHMIQMYKNAGVDWLRELYNMYTLV